MLLFNFFLFVCFDIARAKSECPISNLGTCSFYEGDVYVCGKKLASPYGGDNLKNENRDVKSENGAMKKEVAELKKEYSKMKQVVTSVEQTCRNLKAQNMKLSNDFEGIKQNQEPVAFYAFLSRDYLTSNSIIKYDDVPLNLGNGYDKNSGKFTAPSDGLYVIYVSTGAHYHSYVVVNLMYNDNIVKNNALVDTSIRGQAMFRNLVTIVTPIKMRKGESVHVKITYKGGINKIESSTAWSRSSFSAVKII